MPTSILCNEQIPLLRGEGRYIDDIEFSDMLHVAFVRSPYAHARINNVDTEVAKRQPGVVAVLSGLDIHADIQPIRPLLKNSGFQATNWHAIAWDKVRYVGEAVAVVVASDRYIAEDAAEHVIVEYEPLPVIDSAATGMLADSARVHDNLNSNILLETQSGLDKDDTAFKKGDIKVRANFRHPRVTGIPIENCGVIADYRANTDELVVWSSTQIPHVLRDALCDSLGISAHQIRVVAPDVGGGFGTKMQALPEEIIVSHLARLLHRPIKWTQDRMENIKASFHARDVLVEAELSANIDGTIVGMRAKAICDVGAYNSFPLTAGLEPFTIGSALAGPYDFEYYSYEGYAVSTNKCPMGAYRGVGFVLGPMVMEGLLDKLSQKIGMDPALLRKKNLAQPTDFPFKSPAGPIYDSGDYPALLDLALEESDYSAWRNLQSEARNEGRLLGIGMSCFIEMTGMGRDTYRKRGMVNVPAFDAARLQVDRHGHLEAFISTPSQGQGQKTTFAQLISSTLGAPLDDIKVHLGDTATTPYGSGTFASRSLVSGGGALLKAAEMLQDKLVRIAAAYWQVDNNDLQYVDGRISNPNQSSEHLSLKDLADLAYTPFQELPPSVEPGLSVHVSYNPPPAVSSSAVHMALVEIDKNTYEVKIKDYVVAEDCGTKVNQAIVEGQVRGGITQGIGIALLEELSYDSEGQLLSGSLMDYLVPGIYETPAIKIVSMETPSPWSVGGFKGVGESGTIGAPATITNAILDALEVSAQDIQLPLTPERIFRLKNKTKS
ncbi:MAG: xanthine dehydrogenase family protein molybdopterin-binding subunit [Anaerolineales bacterium]|nr:xanthine dehydrogenase family protein molybdopterin-binding subunit [Anaerolineales bacterium]